MEIVLEKHEKKDTLLGSLISAGLKAKVVAGQGAGGVGPGGSGGLGPEGSEKKRRKTRRGGMLTRLDLYKKQCNVK